MRVSTFHRHAVQRSSPLLGGLLSAHLVFSFVFCFPVLLVGYSKYFSETATKPWTPSWSGFILFFWIVTEPPRLYAGFTVNHYGLLLYGLAFAVLCLIPQMIILSVYLAKVGHQNDVEFGICVTQIALLCLEIIAAVKLSVRLGANDTVNFYIRLGAVQRQAAAEEIDPLTRSGEGSPSSSSYNSPFEKDGGNSASEAFGSDGKGTPGNPGVLRHSMMLSLQGPREGSPTPLRSLTFVS